MSEPTPDPEPALSYLRQYGDRFTLEALRSQLLGAGHDPAKVEEAIAAWQRERAVPPPVETRRAWPLALLVGFGNLLLGGAVLAGATALSSDLAAIAVAALPCLIVAELVAGALLGSSRPRLGRVLLLGSVFTFGLTAVALLIGAGICVYAFASHPNSFH